MRPAVNMDGAELKRRAVAYCLGTPYLSDQRKFLGFSFTAGAEVQRVIAPKALDRSPSIRGREPSIPSAGLRGFRRLIRVIRD